MSVVYVNSTLPGRRAMSADGVCSPVHLWGYAPGPGDRVLAHRLNRGEIHLRAKLGGFDPSLFASVLRELWVGGKRALYLVTQPDLRAAIPLLTRLFPGLRVVTWAWTGREAREQFNRLRRCAHVLCLTEGAHAELLRLGMPPGRCAVALWGADPAFYARPAAPPATRDVLFFGLIDRDVDLVRAVAARADFSLAAPAATLEALRVTPTPRVETLPTPATSGALVDMIHSARVAWVPLRPPPHGDPTGYTNVIEALLGGTAVVLADCSTIPRPVLTLPGVYLYRTGDADSLRDTTRRALADIAAAGEGPFRTRVRAAAAPILDGRALAATIRRALEPPPPPPAAP